MDSNDSSSSSVDGGQNYFTAKGMLNLGINWQCHCFYFEEPEDAPFVYSYSWGMMIPFALPWRFLQRFGIILKDGGLTWSGDLAPWFNLTKFRTWDVHIVNLCTAIPHQKTVRPLCILCEVRDHWSEQSPTHCIWLGRWCLTAPCLKTVFLDVGFIRGPDARWWTLTHKNKINKLRCWSPWMLLGPEGNFQWKGALWLVKHLQVDLTNLQILHTYSDSTCWWLLPVCMEVKLTAVTERAFGPMKFILMNSKPQRRISWKHQTDLDFWMKSHWSKQRGLDHPPFQSPGIAPAGSIRICEIAIFLTWVLSSMNVVSLASRFLAKVSTISHISPLTMAIFSNLTARFSRLRHDESRLEDDGVLDRCTYAITRPGSLHVIEIYWDDLDLTH